MTLEPLTFNTLIWIADERNKDLAPFRTSRYLTEADQENYFKRLATDNTIRMWAITVDDQNIGYGGFENIDWQNRTAEISLFIAEEYRGQGNGSQSVDMLLDQAFDYMGLQTVWGEVYDTTKSSRFWQTIVGDYNGESHRFSDRKFWNGAWHSSTMFNITRNNWVEYNE